MVNPLRVKEYKFPAFTINGAVVSGNSIHSLNGAIEKISLIANFTGSVILWYPDYNFSMVNFSITSGTGLYAHFPFSNTTGSFLVNGPVQLWISGASSGTSAIAGPVSVYYI